MTDTIAYLLYGESGPYHLELTYSVLSVIHQARRAGSRPPRIVLVTDRGNARHDLPVDHRFFTREEFDRWTDGAGYIHRAKIEALGAAMPATGRCVLIDTDTYLLAPPSTLFDRIAPGRFLMHEREPAIGEHDEWETLLSDGPRVVDGYPIDSSSAMCNSGVVGLDAADAGLLVDVLRLCSSLRAIAPVFSAEQFAFTTVLERHGRLSTCSDLVRHYWGFERGFVHAAIERLFPTFSRDSFEANVEAFEPFDSPPKRLRDRLLARWTRHRRKEDGAYQYANLAVRSAFAARRNDPRHADIWARLAVDVLGRHGIAADRADADFASMRRFDDKPWLSPETRSAWAEFWSRG